MRTRRSQFSSDPVSSPATDVVGEHTPVLLHETIESLSIKPDDTVVDATLGGAGHARYLADKLGEKGTLIGFDVDTHAIARAESALAGVKPKVLLVQANFRHLDQELAKLGVRNITKTLFDLGWSAYQLDSGRGFSFLREEPLLMTYATEPNSETLTAKRIVNEWKEESIADVLWGWGEERYSRRIARAIIAERQHKPIASSLQLAEIIARAVPLAYRRGRLHPATRTFQALRIAVNDELGALRDGLKAAWEKLSPQGRIAVITFHSIEDRLVKQLFVAWEKTGEGLRVFKKPIAPGKEELTRNPRARSAKLRTIEKF